MMESLSTFVGTDMSDVDRYVLKQGSTMASGAFFLLLSNAMAKQRFDVNCPICSQCPCIVFAQVCRREGKDLLSFIERLAGTSKLKIAAEEAQEALDDLREKVQRFEVQMSESLNERKQLQPQVMMYNIVSYPYGSSISTFQPTCLGDFLRFNMNASQSLMFISPLALCRARINRTFI